MEMICTVTFNPSLDYIVSVDDFQLGMTNRTSSELILPGGKGINVSIVLKNLGLDSTALGYVAGFTGEELIRRLTEFGVNADFIKINHGMTRINVKLKSIDGTEINGCGPDIDAEALEQLMEKIDRLQEGDVLVLAGSIPYSMPDDIYQRILERIQGRGVLTVVDATRDLLVKVLPYHPFLVKPNFAFRVAKSTDRPIFIILCIQTFTVCTMVPLMSLLGTIESSGITSNLIFIWLQTICLNFIIAYPLQILVVGPFCRFVFRHLFVSASQENEGKIEHEMEQQGFAE